MYMRNLVLLKKPSQNWRRLLTVGAARFELTTFPHADGERDAISGYFTRPLLPISSSARAGSLHFFNFNSKAIATPLDGNSFRAINAHGIPCLVALDLPELCRSSRSEIFSVCP